MNVFEIVVALVIGLIAGATSGALGVGGGAIMVPAMVLILGLDQATAQGTSLLVILPTAITGVYSHLRHRSVDWSPTWLVGLTGAVAAAGGAFLALHISGSLLRILFAVFLVIVGLREIFARSQPRP